MNIKGIIPPVTTPFSAQGDLLLDALQANLERYLETSLAGFLILGSNAEAVHLTRQEALQVVDRAISTVAGKRLVLVGLSAASQREALLTLEDLGKYPLDGLLVSVPNYYKNRMTQAALVQYFRSIADASPFPILLYNVPQYSGLELSPGLVGELASHENIAGMKDSSGNLIYLQHILSRTRPQNFQVLLGSAQVLAPSLVLGIRAAILAVACAFPELPGRILEATGGEEALQQQLEIFEVANIVTSNYGVAGLKYAMDLNGLEGKYCRLPLLPLSDQEKADVERRLGAVVEMTPQARAEVLNAE